MKRKILYLFLSGTFLFTGCNAFLDLEPLDSYTEAVYFRTPEHFEAAALGLHPNVFSRHLNNDASSNNTYPILFDYGTDLVQPGWDVASGTNVPGVSDAYWNRTYIWLRSVNQLIEKAQEYENPDQITKSVGQAFFFRAWHHFFLLKRFGGIPLATEVPDIDSELVWGKRASRYEVLGQILSDLDTAIDNLKGVTSGSTNNDGQVTLEAAKAFKARVCLFAGTWDKYVGTKTDGNGTTTGAGSEKPANYPSVTEFLTMAKNLSSEVIDSGFYELWNGVENVTGTGNNDLYTHTSYFYLFNLENGASNPANLDKSSNKEAIFRSVFDNEYRKGNMNLTHTEPAKLTRKLVDMYLCRDGLPIHLSPDFNGFIDLNAEFDNRDYRLTACLVPFWGYRWGYGAQNSGADYSVDLTTLGTGYMVVPDLRNGGGGYLGRKFRTELSSVTTAGGESADCYHIRLSEVYLIYAEATCELGNGNISDADLDYSINKVRARGGVAPLNAALLARAASLGGSLNFLDEIRRERALELYAEGHRLSDLCRWGIAEQELGDVRCGVYLTYNGQNTELITLNSPVDGNPVYLPSAYSGKVNNSTITYYYEGLTPTQAGAAIVEDKSNRHFSLKNYLQPIPTDQIVLNPTLLQNPEW